MLVWVVRETGREATPLGRLTTGIATEVESELLAVALVDLLEYRCVNEVPHWVEQVHDSDEEHCCVSPLSPFPLSLPLQVAFLTEETQRVAVISKPQTDQETLKTSD